MEGLAGAAAKQFMQQTANRYAPQAEPLMDTLTGRASRAAQAAARVAALARQINSRTQEGLIQPVPEQASTEPDHVIFALTRLEGELEAAEQILLEVQKRIG